MVRRIEHIFIYVVAVTGRSTVTDPVGAAPVSLVEQGKGVEPFLVQIHPPLNFSDDFAQLN